MANKEKVAHFLLSCADWSWKRFAFDVILLASPCLSPDKKMLPSTCGGTIRTMDVNHQTHRQTDRQIDRQTDRWTERQTERHARSEIYRYRYSYCSDVVRQHRLFNAQTIINLRLLWDALICARPENRESLFVEWRIHWNSANLHNTIKFRPWCFQ